ncbi:hypothetical protein [Spirosoma sp.]|uniref:hypothetical protein n=1 Tax=Spirosoma sp. TaxID=1899569 RepID=UPI0026333549|nr:hypothetical protein [Spirosoma sp.]MCX6216374.1 hypothetical protein [Spirosoma sp.]
MAVPFSSLTHEVDHSRKFMGGNLQAQHGLQINVSEFSKVLHAVETDEFNAYIRLHNQTEGSYINPTSLCAGTLGVFAGNGTPIFKAIDSLQSISFRR